MVARPAAVSPLAAGESNAGGPDLQAVYARGIGLWLQAERVAALLAVDPVGLGGVHIAGGEDELVRRWLEGLAGLLPPGAPQVMMPAHGEEAALLGGLSVERSLASGRLVAEPGLLARADGGLLVARRAESLDAARAALIAGAVDHGEIRIERSGLSQADPAAFSLVLLDTGEPGEPPPPGALLDRVAFRLGLGAVPDRCADDFAEGRAEIEAARKRLAGVAVSDDALEAIMVAAGAVGIASLRAPIFVLRAARAIAALDGEPAVTAAALEEAGALVLGHRAALVDLPPAPEPEPPEPEPPGPDDSPSPPEDAADASEAPEQGPDQETGPEDGAAEDRLIEAIRSAAAAAALDALAARLPSPGATAARAGRSGAESRRQSNGRPDRALPRQRLRSGRIDLPASLRAALPMQRLRSRKAGPARTLHLRPDDLRVKTYRHRSETTVIFLVDASGSSALNRMGEAKGAVEHLLSDCYSRRDHVALIAVRGAQPELLLPPCRALTRAKRALSSLPSGGTTPLAGGLELAGEMAAREGRAGRTPFIVILSDGRGNVALDGSTERARAGEDLDRAARHLATLGAGTLYFDTARRPGARGEALARTLGADYRHLPFASARRISEAVRDKLGPR